MSENSIYAVNRIFRDIGPKLKLAAIPEVENYSPVEVKQYLMRNHFKFCVLLVDAETVKDDCGNMSRRKDDYEDLLKTAANEVGEIGFHSRNERLYLFRCEAGGEALC